MSEVNIQQNIEKVLKIGYKILMELEKKDPDIEGINKLYEYRSDAIDKVTGFKEEQFHTLSAAKRENTKDLFTRLHVLEKQLKRNLAKLSNRKQEALQKLNNHSEAKKSYIQSTTNHQQVAKIVDLKSQD